MINLNLTLGLILRKNWLGMDLRVLSGAAEAPLLPVTGIQL